MALKLGECGAAFDTLTDPTLVGRSNVLSTNLKLDTLIKVGRLEEAMLLVKTEVLSPNPRRHARRTVYFEVMERLANAIKTTEGANSDMAKDFTMICNDIDEFAHVSDKKLEEELFKPIEGKRERTKRRSRSRENEDEFDEEEEV